MKKHIIFVLAIFLCFFICACGNSASHEGEVKTPSGSSVMKGRPFQEVIDEFENHGFLNIKVEKIEDLITGWLTSDGEVEQVSVGGDVDYSPDQWVPNDTEVIIYYHTFAEEPLDETIDTENNTTHSNEPDSFWDILNKDVKEFEFELNDKGDAYILKEYNSMSPDATNEAIIPSTHEGLPVTEIASQAFYACDKLESVVIPEGIVEIGSYAFYHCTSLKSIHFPESLRRIKEYAFEGCDDIESLEILQPLRVGFRAFYECEALKVVSLGKEGETVTIEDYAFHDCDSLETVTIYAMSIGGNSFSWCENLTTVTLSEDLTRIGDSAFEHSENLQQIIFYGNTEQWAKIQTEPWWDKDIGNCQKVYIEK